MCPMSVFSLCLCLCVCVPWSWCSWFVAAPQHLTFLLSPRRLKLANQDRGNQSSSKIRELDNWVGATAAAISLEDDPPLLILAGGGEGDWAPVFAAARDGGVETEAGVPEAAGTEPPLLPGVLLGGLHSSMCSGSSQGPGSAL
mmetsp:Transcript_27636/g.80754  ORF Transcript_27636/g.80754 Transcript_27636/m.80754 type:complete len:143 (+) Transcript_27636:319-747(+)